MEKKVGCHNIKAIGFKQKRQDINKPEKTH